MILALEGKYEDFTLGRKLDLNKIRLISDLAVKHGFKLAGFRNFERAVTEEEINSIKNLAWQELKVHG